MLQFSTVQLAARRLALRILDKRLQNVARPTTLRGRHAMPRPGRRASPGRVASVIFYRLLSQSVNTTLSDSGLVQFREAFPVSPPRGAVTRSAWVGHRL